jgi:hypothetical protein
MTESRGRYFNRQGKPMSVEEWVGTRGTGYPVVAVTDVDDIEVYTSWVGVTFSSADVPPDLFRTEVMSAGPLSGRGEQYATEVEALAGHDRWVALAGLAAAGRLMPEGDQVADDVCRLLRNHYGFVPDYVLHTAANRAVRAVVGWQYEALKTEGSPPAGGGNTAS